MLDADTIEKIADLGAQADKARLFTLPDGRTVFANGVFSGDGGSKTVIETLTSPTKDARGEFLAPPSRIKGTITIQTADSLVDYVNRFKTEGTTLFADIANSQILAALDYHKDANTTAHAGHGAVLKMPFSEEWKYWTNLDRIGLMTQIDFARAIRENAADISAPPAADLLEIVKDLQAVRNVNFTQSVRLNSENESFEYSDDSKATTRKGGVELPDRFTLRIPVYFDGRTYELGAFLRHKIEDGKLFLGIKLHRAEHVRQAVFKEVVRDVSESSGAPYVYGNP